MVLKKDANNSLECVKIIQNMGENSTVAKLNGDELRAVSVSNIIL
jgi:hypothetical protein